MPDLAEILFVDFGSPIHAGPERIDTQPVCASSHNWEFPKMRGTLFWDPRNKDPIIWGTILGSPYFRKLPTQAKKWAAENVCFGSGLWPRYETDYYLRM